jgi:hypothetical protein
MSNMHLLQNDLEFLGSWKEVLEHLDYLEYLFHLEFLVFLEVLVFLGSLKEHLERLVLQIFHQDLEYLDYLNLGDLEHLGFLGS